MQTGFVAGRHTAWIRYLGLSLLFAASAVQASGDASMWASPSANSYSVSAFTAKGATATHLQALQQQQQNSLQVTQFLGNGNALAMRYSQALQQRDIALGYTWKDATISYMSGSGEDYAELGGQYTGVDPYLFHGGWKQQFDYDGLAVDYSVGSFGHLQYGQATMRSDGLLDRTARYMEWSNSRLFARATRFVRGGEAIGSGLDAGFNFGNKRLAIQTMDLENDRSMQRIRLQLDGNRTRQYWFDIASHRNALYRANDDVRVMFTFKTMLGAKSLASYADENNRAGNPAASPDDDPEGSPDAAPAAKKRNPWIARGLLIGVGVAAAAGGSSSGSPVADRMLRFKTQSEAALGVLNGINPTSIRENREYGGWVFINPDASYASTTPKKGEATKVQLPPRSVVIPSGSRATASYHTHAAYDPRYDNENFSQRDLDNDKELGLDGYLATPAGQFKYHNVTTGEILVLGRVATGG